MQKREEYNKASYETLKASAFEVLLLHPGCGYEAWLDTLMNDYTLDIIDVFGTDEKQMKNGLADLWRTRYHDTYSGKTHTIEDWATQLSSDAALQEYYNHHIK